MRRFFTLDCTLNHSNRSNISGFVKTACTALTLVALTSIASTAHAQITVSAYLSAPNTQLVPASITGPTSENFSGLTTGTKTTYTDAAPFSSAIGNYSGRFAVVADNQYGTGTGNYFAIGAQSTSATPVTLTFASPVRYFGMSYNAGDRNNGFTFYDTNNEFIGRYSTADLVGVLNGGQGSVTALDGSVYATSKYYGKPNGAGPDAANTGTNTQEPYAFLNFFIDGGSVSKIVFDNSNTTGSGFESDNHTISTAAQTPVGGKFVFVGTASAAPEPGTIALLLTAGVPVVGIIRRRKK